MCSGRQEQSKTRDLLAISGSESSGLASSRSSSSSAAGTTSELPQSLEQSMLGKSGVRQGDEAVEGMCPREHEIRCRGVVLDLKRRSQELQSQLDAAVTVRRGGVSACSGLCVCVCITERAVGAARRWCRGACWVIVYVRSIRVG